MADRKPYRRFNAQHAAGRLAVKVFVCTNRRCEIHHRGVLRDNLWYPPQQCNCGGIQFDRFDSITEAKWWAGLRQQENVGLIADLRRQVWFDLYAYGPSGEAIKVGAYVADATWFDVEEQEFVVGDAKPKAGVDDLADLKMKIMAANGHPVTVYTPT